MTTRAALYARVSTDDRYKTGGENLADQLRLCREYAEQRGYHVEIELAEDDRGASGATFDLPQLSRALEMARAGQFGVLIVRELDRLSRDLAKQLIVEQELRRVGVTIEYVLYDFPDTPEGRLNKNLRAMLAEYEREKINQRMTRGRNRKARNGDLTYHGRIPYGYRRVSTDHEEPLAIDEAQAAVVQRIFQWYTEGDETGGPLGASSIALRLTEEGVPAWSDLHTNIRKTSHGGWRRSGILGMLANETYAGTWRYGAQKIPVEVPAIVSRDTWEAAQRQRETNTIQAKRNTHREYLMQHRLWCPTCHTRMLAITKKRPWGDDVQDAYYACQRRFDQTGIPCDHRRHYRAEIVDAAVWDWLRDKLGDPAKLEQSLRDYQAQREEQLAPVRAERDATDDLIRDTEAKKRRLLASFLDELFERDVLEDQVRQFDDRLAKLRARLAELQAQLDGGGFTEARIQSILEFASIIGEGIEWADQDFAKRRELVDLLDVEAVLLPEGEHGTLELRGALPTNRVPVVPNGSGTIAHNLPSPYLITARIVLSKPGAASPQEAPEREPMTNATQTPAKRAYGDSRGTTGHARASLQPEQSQRVKLSMAVAY